MHELSISSAIVETVLRHAHGRRVTSVQIRIGALRQVVSDSLRFYFEIVARDTVCDGARLDLELVGAWMSCPTCGHGWDPAPEPVAGREGEAHPMTLPAFRCPACELGGAEIARGDELEVESIEVIEGAHAVASSS